MEEFKASRVYEITGVKRNRLQVWMERGWITPSIEEASGHGTRNVFNRKDLYFIAMFKELVARGLPRKTIGAFFSSIMGHYHQMSDSVIEGIEYWFFGRSGGQLRADAIFSDNIDEPISIFLQENHVKGSGFYDDLYFINFRKIREKVDLKAG